MTTIARIIVTETDLQKKHQLFTDFINESKKLLLKGEKHQFVLLPAGFLMFDANDLTGVALTEPQDKVAKQKWNSEIEVLKEQALTEFHRAFDAAILKQLKSVAQYLVIGINSHDRRIQFVLVYDLQSGKPLHWTGKSYPNGKKEWDALIKMPIDSHFMKVKIGGKKVAVFGCHDLSIFNPRHQKHFSPFDDERKGSKRKETTASRRIKCPFIDATLDFNPEIMLQLPHTEATWAAKWTTLNKWLKRKNKGEGLQHFATGLKRNPNKHYSLSGTQHGDVVNFANGTWVTK